MRDEVVKLLEKSRISSNSSIQAIREWQDCFEKIVAPVSDEEAAAQTSLVPDTEDDCFGLSWSLVHLIETAPNWPLAECLQGNGYWITLLRNSARNAGHDI